MRQWLRLRDGKCHFPGCSNQSLDNDADHLLAWHHGGTTGISNLGQPCRKHHRLKHTTTWNPTEATKNEPPGWTSPTGRHYQSEHPDWEPPVWPEPIVERLHGREPFPGPNHIVDPLPDPEPFPGPDHIVDPLPYKVRGTSLPESLSEIPIPADPDREWACLLRRRLNQPEPLRFASVPDFLWLTEQPLAGSGARSSSGSTG
jgi:hypothetical protein